MKVLILSCNTGQGHNAAGQALYEEFQARGVECAFLDALSLSNDAVSNAIRENLGIRFSNLTYKEHALEEGSSSQAVAYVSITGEDGQIYWGVGIQDDIIYASVKALFSAVNRMIR